MPFRTFLLTLFIGLNALTGTCFGLASQNSVQVIAVGSNISFKRGLKSLKYAESDAKQFVSAMEGVGLVKHDNLQVLNGPTLKELRTQLDLLTKKNSKQSAEMQKFIFYFSGHSDEEGLHLKDGLLSKSELHRWMAAMNSHAKIAILDSCFSGALAAKGVTGDTSFEIPKAQFDEPSGSVFLTAASDNQFAFESENYKGSVFTHHLLSGLYGEADGNGDGIVTIDELYQHVYRLTRIQSLTGPTKQEPSMSTELRGRGAIAMAFPAMTTGQVALDDQIIGDMTFASRKGMQLFRLEKEPGKFKKILLPTGDFVVTVQNGTSVGSTQIKVAPKSSSQVRLADLSWNSNLGNATGSKGDSDATSSAALQLTNSTAQSYADPETTKTAFVGMHSGYGKTFAPGPFVGVAMDWYLYKSSGMWKVGPGAGCDIHRHDEGWPEATSYSCMANIAASKNFKSVRTSFTLGAGQTWHISKGSNAFGPGAVFRAAVGGKQFALWSQLDVIEVSIKSNDESKTAYRGSAIGILYRTDEKIE